MLYPMSKLRFEKLTASFKRVELLFLSCFYVVLLQLSILISSCYCLFVFMVYFYHLSAFEYLLKQYIKNILLKFIIIRLGS